MEVNHDAAVLARIQLLVSRGDIRYSSHALDRMDERGATRADVVRGISTATDCRWSDEHHSWQLSGGSDVAGDSIFVAANYNEIGVLVRTIT